MSAIVSHDVSSEHDFPADGACTANDECRACLMTAEYVLTDGRAARHRVSVSVFNRLYQSQR